MKSEYSYPKAILHIDGDAFFASCEQATNSNLRGKPIAVGHERGIATAYSYEAKALGVTRGLKVSELKRDYPEVLLVSSDYKKYSLFSNRFKQIVLRTCDKVEKNSIDELYADITGLDKRLGCSYEKIALQIQSDLHTALGITFSIGLGPTKTLAKIGSNCNKPHGLTVITKDFLYSTLYKLPIGHVPGIGYRSVPKMNIHNIFTIHDFISKKHEYVMDMFSKPYQELHQELRGIGVKEFETGVRIPQSISKIHAFRVPTSNPEYLLSELSRHSEIIARKLSRIDRGATRVRCGVKTFEEMTISEEFVLQVETRDPHVIYSVAEKLFWKIVNSHKKYRATYLVVSGLKEQDAQIGLFSSETHNQQDMKQVLKTIKSIEDKYGIGTITRASSSGNTRDRQVHNANPLVYDSWGKKVLSLPFLGDCR